MMMHRTRNLLGLAFCSLAMLYTVEAWGKEGHYAICKFAEPLLSKAAAAAVNDLVPEDLASLCSWADEQRFRYPWSRSLHFINTPDNKCTYQYSRDCYDEDGDKGRCLAAAINNYTSQLQTYGTNSAEQYNLTEALLFLSHFIGDIHQPLHVGFTTDRGGNTIHIHWYGRQTNLHHAWDTSIIETAMDDYYNNDLDTMVEAIQQNITDSWSDQIPTWQACNDTACPNPYAVESIALACQYAYAEVEDGSTLGDDYFSTRLPIVEKQLAKGGVRLAGTLNRLFK